MVAAVTNALSDLPEGSPEGSPARRFRAGRFCWRRSVAVLPPTARPDQIVGVVLAVEEVGEDGSVEAWVIELDGEVVAALVGALGPGGPDLGTADEDPVGGRVVAGPIGFGDDADVPRLHAQGHDLAL